MDCRASVLRALTVSHGVCRLRPFRRQWSGWSAGSVPSFVGSVRACTIGVAASRASYTMPCLSSSLPTWQRVRKDATVRPNVCATTNRLVGVGIAIQTRGGPLAEKNKHDHEDRTTQKKDPQSMPARQAPAATANTPKTQGEEHYQPKADKQDTKKIVQPYTTQLVAAPATSLISQTGYGRQLPTSPGHHKQVPRGCRHRLARPQPLHPPPPTTTPKDCRNPPQRRRRPSCPAQPAG